MIGVWKHKSYIQEVIEVIMSIDKIGRDALVDIRDVVIDTSLPKEERMKSYLQQVKNPYIYKHGKYVVKIGFTDTNVTLEELLVDYVRLKMRKQ